MKPARAWPLAIVSVLAITVGANVFILWAAHGRDADVVEPDYYGKAVRWDSTAARARASARLGWRLEAALGPLAPAGDTLRVALCDRDGAALEGARVDVTAIHNRDAGRPVHATLDAAGPGAYRAVLPLRHPGLWELRFEVERGGQRFLADLRRDAAPGPP